MKGGPGAAMRVAATSTASALTACSNAVPIGGSAGSESASAATTVSAATLSMRDADDDDAGER